MVIYRKLNYPPKAPNCETRRNGLCSVIYAHLILRWRSWILLLKLITMRSYVVFPMFLTSWSRASRKAPNQFCFHHFSRFFDEHVLASVSPRFFSSIRNVGPMQRARHALFATWVSSLLKATRGNKGTRQQRPMPELWNPIQTKLQNPSRRWKPLRRRTNRRNAKPKRLKPHASNRLSPDLIARHSFVKWHYLFRSVYKFFLFQCVLFPSWTALFLGFFTAHLNSLLTLQ